MSETTKTALEEAIAAHILDECDGDHAGAYILVTETTTLEEMDNDREAFRIDTRNMQSSFTSDGLLYAALRAGGYGKDDDDD